MSSRRALVLGIVANALGGTSYFLQKLALLGFTPGVLLFLRSVLATPLLFAIAPRGWTRSATRADWARMAAIGVFGLAVPHLLGVYGLRDTQSLNGALLIGVEPVAIVALSALLLRERITGGQAIGLLCAVSGAALVITKGDFTSFAVDPSTRGNLLLGLSGVMWSIYSVAGKPTLERVPPAGVTATSSTISLLILGPAALLELPSFDSSRALAIVPIAAVIALALVVSFLATILWNTSLKEISATQMAALVFLQPIAGTVLGVVAGEPLPPVTIAGGMLVFAGVYFTHRPRVETSG